MSPKKLKVVTDFPVAWESPDHILPTGTKNDNSTNSDYIREVEEYFQGRKINVMDVGCAGGQLIVDFSGRGHTAIGIEGSDYNIKHKLHNWPEHYKSILWTADITKPFRVEDEDGNRVLFDIISAWEVVEHIHPSELNLMFDNILDQLKPDGVFVASVNMGPDTRRDESGVLHVLHQSVFPEEFWRTKILHERRVSNYPFNTKVRVCDNSFFITLQKGPKSNG